MDKVLGIFKNLPDFYKKVGIPVVIAVIVILGYLVYYQDQRVKQYSRELELLDERIAEKEAEIDKKVGILEGQQKSLEHKFGDLTIIISDQIFSDQIGKDFFKFIDDPKGRRLYREQQKIIINEIYGDFFADIALSEQETEELKNLLIDKQMVNLEIIISLLKGNMTNEQIAQNEKKFAEMIVRADSNLRDFFEDDEFNLFQEYNLSLQYRNWILEFKSYLAEKEIFLDEIQEENLLDLIFNETENFNYTEKLPVSEFSSSNLSDADRARIDGYLEEKEELDEIIVDKSREFFNDEEVKALEDYLKLLRNMDEMGFEITEDINPAKPVTQK